MLRTNIGWLKHVETTGYDSGAQLPFIGDLMGNKWAIPIYIVFQVEDYHHLEMLDFGLSNHHRQNIDASNDTKTASQATDRSIDR